MAKGKGKVSFMFYYDYLEKLEYLTAEEIVQILKDICKYDQEGVIPEYEDRTLKMVFSFIKDRLDRDKAAYNERCERSRENGSKGGRPRKGENLEKPTGYFGLENKPKKPDKDKDKEIDNNVCVYNNSKNSRYCHLKRNYKIEACESCLKNSHCPLKTDPRFILEKGCKFEEWLAKRQVFTEQIITSQAEISEEDMEILENYDYLAGDNDG